MQWKKGWIENRKTAAKVNQLVDYYVLRGEDSQFLASSPNYAHTGIHHGTIGGVLAKLLKCEPADLEDGTIMVCGPDSIQEGFHMEVQMTLQNYNCKLKFIAEAVAVQMEPEMKEMVFSAGVKVLAANKADMELLNRIIEQKKKK
jgi:hypothetical protein